MPTPTYPEEEPVTRKAVDDHEHPGGSGTANAAYNPAHEGGNPHVYREGA